MVDNYYPKVLVIGHYPGDFSGISIALNNLFYQGHSEKLSVASCYPINKKILSATNLGFNCKIFRSSK